MGSPPCAVVEAKCCMLLVHAWLLFSCCLWVGQPQSYLEGFLGTGDWQWTVVAPCWRSVTSPILFGMYVIFSPTAFFSLGQTSVDAHHSCADCERPLVPSSCLDKDTVGSPTIVACDVTVITHFARLAYVTTLASLKAIMSSSVIIISAGLPNTWITSSFSWIL